MASKYCHVQLVSVAMVMAVSFLGKCSIAPKGWSSLESDEESTEKENKRPSWKRLRLSLQKDDDWSESRFKLVRHEELSTLAAHNPPQNVKASTSWTVRNMHEWFKWHNSPEGTEQRLNEFCRIVQLLCLKLHFTYMNGVDCVNI